MNLSGTIVYYKFDTGEHLRTELVSMPDFTLNDAIDHCFGKAKEEEKCYKQIFIKDNDTGKNIFYKANFK